MKIQLREINSPSEFKAAPLRDRASVSTKSVLTTQYAAISGGQEIAFVALDLPGHKKYLFVYELFVAPSLRSRGYGTAVIQKCREFAIQAGFEKICLKPWPLEASGSEDRLRVWYNKLGFVQSPEQNDLMQVIFSVLPDERIA